MPTHTSFKRIALLAALLLLVLACNMPTGPKPTPTQPVAVAKPTKPPTSTPKAATADNVTVDYLYTSELITAIYQLYGSYLDDFLIAKIKNDNNKDIRVVVRSEIIDYTTQASDTITVPAGEEVEVRQNPRLTTSSIDRLNSAKPADFHIRVAYLDNGQEREILDQTNTTTIYARRDFPWAIKGFTEQEVFELLASMVTPTDPAVEGLIRDAANYQPDGIMTSGYNGIQNDDQNQVWDRLQAIWSAEEKVYKLTYISTYVSYAKDEVQRIRMPSDVLNQHSGNCIELALLFASTAEALSLQPAIILVPGHAYVAVRIDDVNDKYYFVETTMIGRATFEQAVQEGVAEWKDAKPNVNNNVEQYGWVTIAEARKKGILPIPWK